jgi:hypothetical protein
MLIDDLAAAEVLASPRATLVELARWMREPSS